jgi:hypothetical protein
MAIVEDDLWVVANFKETQLEEMRPNQTVSLVIDAFPNHAFRGRLGSIAPGSGNQFALLPPDNATGNFTKIVQRIPVKILFDPASIKEYEKLSGARHVHGSYRNDQIRGDRMADSPRFPGGAKPTGPTEERVSLRTWIAVAGTLLGCFMAVLDIIITNLFATGYRGHTWRKLRRDLLGFLPLISSRKSWSSRWTGWLAAAFSLKKISAGKLDPLCRVLVLLRASSFP